MMSLVLNHSLLWNVACDACVSVAIIVAHEKRGVGTIQDAFLFCFVYERLSVTSVTSMFVRCGTGLGHTEKSVRQEAINAG